MADYIVQTFSGWIRSRAACSCSWSGRWRWSMARAMDDAIIHAHNAHPANARVGWGGTEL